LLQKKSKNMATVKKAIKAKKTTATEKPVVKVAATKKTEEKISAHIPVYGVSGEKTGAMTAPASIFDGKVNMQLIALAIRVYLANQREGSASTKTRGLVEGSTRKIYKQKGTGRARHGGIRAPIFVGGGVVFGPQPRDYTLHFPQSMRLSALKSAFSMKLKEEAIIVLGDTAEMKPKTKTMSECFTKIGATRKVLVIVDDMHGALTRSVRNIAGVTVQPAQNVTTYEVAMNKKIVCTKEAMKQLEKRFV